MDKNNMPRKGNKNTPYHAQGSSFQMIDPVNIAPRIYRILFENSHVRVLEVNVEPGNKEPMHSHPPHVIYVLSGGWIRFRTHDDFEDVEFEKGSTRLIDAVPLHSMENMGATKVRAIIIERKNKEITSLWGRDPVIASPESYNVIAENKYFRVVALKMKPGASDDYYRHPVSIYYVPSNSQGKLHFRSGTGREMRFRKGDIGFSEAKERLRIENTGSRELHLILFELKDSSAQE